MEKSRIIQGLMRINEMSIEELKSLIEFDLKHGINFFDTSNIYGNGVSESKIGEVLKLNPSLRSKMIIQSKCGIYLDENNKSYYDLSKEMIIKSCNETLKRLNTTYLDYFLLHRPDIFIDNKEVAEAFNILYKEKKVLHFGVSNFSKELIDYLEEEVKEKIEVNQLQLGLGHTLLISDVFNYNTAFYKDNAFAGDLFFYLKRKNINLQCWSPYQYGMFEGNILYNEKFKETNLLLEQLASKYQVNKSSICLSFLLMLGENVSVVIGTTNKQHIIDSIDALKVKLTKVEWYNLYRSANNLLP